MLNPDYFNWLEWAIAQIKSGFVNRLEKFDTVVYRCGTVIRIDLKKQFDATK